LEADRLREADIVICCADGVSARDARQLLGANTTIPFIDLSGGLEGLPEARLRSPMAEPAVNSTDYARETSSVYVIAHPVSSALALVLLRLNQAYPVRQSVVQVFAPASELGQAAISELQQQVASLLSFRPLEKRIFDAQLAFNLLPKFGEDAPEKLEDMESRVERHLATLLAGKAPLPSLRLIQAPVFHGHTFSLWLELMDSRPDMEDFEAELDSVNIEVRGKDVEPPSNVGAAGESGVITGLIEPDRNHLRGVWLWAALDNYRVMADDAVAVAKQILAGEAS
ncbi:MAG: hypothetical protein H7Y20_04855, partial [Bryobacteraceae bacterium]|nr:hypothetical protein [Bryobacteraceae bacterium]